mmetsp:Transcript_22409/g.27017  ORF Transcript_22409/g.27017 Transcript_22409/m.27017 type:complete len:197 (-) Transcript_22409:826-1416(-)|eukprot:CAMPEP_0197860720 /NCGR_PEP_ID=MMETSP1438-20131217/36308_1 /TAXON_ID=1461541 /ORGANISM="Pterosperma sp., Strain CCMP1384" /LENGTH=196 /DNA_ID=CAMNT_0043477687 /DNA_START=200 /DNA_END=790 /DNA_ORIENTATION=+
MPTQYQLSQKAYIKVILHAAKHPSQSVNGVLIGTASKENDTVEIHDAVPLFHGQLALAPMLEVALMQVDAHCSSINQAIVGYYHANERFDDYVLPSVGKKIADRVYANCQGACALLVDNAKLRSVTTSEPEVALKVYTKETKAWIEEASSVLKLTDSACLGRLTKMLQEDQQDKLHDFSNHLDDLQHDWLNPDILK